LAVSAAMLLMSRLPKPLRAVYIHPHWNPDVNQTGDSVFARLAQSGINTVFVDVYYPMRAHIRESTTESFTLRVRAKGSWTVELVTDLLSSNGDTVTVRVSNLNQEFPGYIGLRAAISVVLVHCDGFCVYALNDLSPDEFNAIRECSRGNFTIECISSGYLCGRLRQSMLSRILFLPTYHGRSLNHLLRREAPRLSTFQNDSHL